MWTNPEIGFLGNPPGAEPGGVSFNRQGHKSGCKHSFQHYSRIICFQSLRRDIVGREVSGSPGFRMTFSAINPLGNECIPRRDLAFVSITGFDPLGYTHVTDNVTSDIALLCKQQLDKW
jgi:hypothetical protein